MPNQATETLTSVCPLDCPDNCSLEITLDEGRVTKVGAGPANPTTAGFICSKVRGFADLLGHETRLSTPLIRVAGKGKGNDTFRAISWDTALDHIAERFRAIVDEHGAEAILPFCYGGSNGRFTQDSADAALFRRMGASHLLRTVCAVPTSMANAAMYGRMPGVSFHDFEHARGICVWGTNPHASGIHQVPHLLAAKENGAKLLVVDPRRTSLAKKADHHLAPRPGTDLPLALSIHRFLFEEGRADRDFLARHADQADALEARAHPWTFERAAEVCELRVADIEAFAVAWADADPGLMRCGWGPERNRNGGSAICAILALPAVAGKFGKRGGGVLMSNSGAVRMRPACSDPVPPVRSINMNRLGRVLLGEEQLSPPIAALFVYNANPLTSLPDQERVRRGLEREDLFTIVFDQVMTDTARYADIVLPATTFLEHHELSAGYGSLSAQYAAPAIGRHGESRPNYEVFQALLERLDLARPDDDFTPAAMLRRCVEDEGRRSALENGEVLAPEVGATPVQFVDHFPKTPNGRIQLVPPALDEEVSGGLYHYQEEVREPRFPLALISPATSRTVSTMFGQLHEDEVPLAMHPDDATARGLNANDEVVCFNELGEVATSLVLDGDLKPGVVCLPKGIWSKSTRNGSTSNALCPDTLGDVGGGACFNDARVEVRRA